LELSTDKSEQGTIKKALQDLKEMEELNRKREKDMSKKMFKFPDSKKVESKPKPDTNRENLIVEESKEPSTCF
jgi:hypothetical protein